MEAILRKRRPSLLSVVNPRGSYLSRAWCAFPLGRRSLTRVARRVTAYVTKTVCLQHFNGPIVKDCGHRLYGARPR